MMGGGAQMAAMMTASQLPGGTLLSVHLFTILISTDPQGGGGYSEFSAFSVRQSFCSCHCSGATKGALDMLTKVMALELGPHQVPSHLQSMEACLNGLDHTVSH